MLEQWVLHKGVELEIMQDPYGIALEIRSYKMSLKTAWFNSLY
jgi:hypothetical protein